MRLDPNTLGDLAVRFAPSAYVRVTRMVHAATPLGSGYGATRFAMKTEWCEPEANRIAGRLVRHAGELTTFLWNERVDPSNNAAERSLRPAVVMRKITGGSRSERGAKATAVLMSVLRTIKQQSLPMFETIKSLLRNAWSGENPGLLTDVG